MTTKEFVKTYGSMAYEIAWNDCEDPTEDFSYLSRQFDEFIEEAGEDAYWTLYEKCNADNFLAELDDYLEYMYADPRDRAYEERCYWASV